MKKILLLILASMMVFGLFGCGETLPEDEMLIARAEELIPRTEEFNRLFYIEGIPLKEGGKEENENLKLTEKEHIELYIKQGMDKKEALKAVAKERGVSKSSLYKYTTN